MGHDFLMTETLTYTLGLSSMGCPDATLEEILSLAEAFRLQYVELRSLGNTIDLPAYLDNATAPAQGHPEVRLLATPLCIFKASPEAVLEFQRFAELARRFNTPYLRVFANGGNLLGDPPSEATLVRGAAVIEDLRAYLRQSGCPAEIVVETHDTLSSAERCLALNAQLKEPVKILWDSFHTWNLGGESPRETWSQIGQWVVQVHHHDCAQKPGSVETGFVPSGTGKYPCQDLRALLDEVAFRGGLTLEWEKLWHPELPHVREVLGDFIRVFGS